MSEHKFAQLREGQAGCPSDLMLDRLHADELAPAAAEGLTLHIASCPSCASRMESRRAGFARFAGADPERILAGVRKRLAEPDHPPARTSPPMQTHRRWLRSAGLAVAPLAAAAALVGLFVIRRGPADVSSTDGPGGPESVRLKGGPALHVFRLVGERSQRVMSGERLSPGDRLRFVVDLPQKAQVTIVGIERDGTLYTAWPLGASAEGAGLRPAGSGQELPGAVALDQSLGQEPLYLVYCPDATTPPHCTSQGATEAPSCQSGCVLQKFMINKGS